MAKYKMDSGDKDDLALAMFILGDNADDLENMAEDANENAEDDSIPDIEITMDGQVFIALYNAHMIMLEALLESGILDESDLEKRFIKLGGGERLN